MTASPQPPDETDQPRHGKTMKMMMMIIIIFVISNTIIHLLVNNYLGRL
jgi:hypothetical protein